MLKWKSSDMNSVDFRMRVSFNRELKCPRWLLDIGCGNGRYREYAELLLDLADAEDVKLL